MTALFVGLCTLDVIQLVPHVPGSNEKLTAHRQTIAAGGPATNAAVTCSHLGHPATLVTAIGSHPLAAGIHADLDAQGVTIVDMDAASVDPPTVSSILVTESTGDRAVASTNAAGRGFLPPANLDALVADASVVERVRHVIESEINPQLASHGGRVSLREITADGVVELQFGGGCHGCGMVDKTLRGGVEKTLKARVPEVTGVADATDHDSGSTPYYRRQA